jgi:hypothetical protein
MIYAHDTALEVVELGPPVLAVDDSTMVTAPFLPYQGLNSVLEKKRKCSYNEQQFCFGSQATVGGKLKWKTS